MEPLRPSRRTTSAGRAAAGCGWLGCGLTGCTASESSPPGSGPGTAPTPTGGATTADRVLLGYFSRPGENYYYGGRRDLAVGNTEVLGRMIAELIDCDVYRIEASDPYPDGYDATVARNVAEQNADTDRRSPIRWPRSTAISACCWAARSGMCDPR